MKCHPPAEWCHSVLSLSPAKWVVSLGGWGRLQTTLSIRVRPLPTPIQDTVEKCPGSKPRAQDSSYSLAPKVTE